MNTDTIMTSTHLYEAYIIIALKIKQLKEIQTSLQVEVFENMSKDGIEKIGTDKGTITQTDVVDYFYSKRARNLKLKTLALEKIERDSDSAERLIRTVLRVSLKKNIDSISRGDIID